MCWSIVVKEKSTVGSLLFCAFSCDRIHTVTKNVITHLFIDSSNSCKLSQRILGTFWSYYIHLDVKVKVISQQAEVAEGVLGRLRPQIFWTFSTAQVVGHQPYALATFTPGEIPGTHFQRLSWPPGHMVLSVAMEKIPSDTTGNRSRDLPTNSALP